MSNFDLNIGGLIGALLCGGIAAGVIFSAQDAESNRGTTKLIIVALTGGAVAGNFL